MDTPTPPSILNQSRTSRPTIPNNRATIHTPLNMWNQIPIPTNHKPIIMNLRPTRISLRPIKMNRNIMKGNIRKKLNNI